MSASDCSADEGHPCDAGNNGDPCAECVAEYAYWQRRYFASPKEPTLLEQNEALRDAGRGHLCSR